MTSAPYRQILEAYYGHPDNKPLAKYPGVTRVLGGTKDMTGLDAWRARVGDEEADRILEESRVIGNSLDAIFNESLGVNRDSFDLEAYSGEVGYKLFKQLQPTIKRIDPIGTQLKVWNDHLKYMGYLDCLGIYNGKLTLIDCKNSRKEKREEYLEDYWLQTAGYSIALFEMMGMRPSQVMLMVARRDSPFPQIIVRDLKPYVLPFVRRVNQYYQSISG